MREGREPARGRDTRHVLPSLAGAPAGKAPACGRLLPPCAGLALALPAGATAGTPARRRRSPRPAARECARRRRLRRQCARRYKLRAPAGARPQAAGRGPACRWKRRGPRPRYAGRRVRRQSRAARPAPQAWPGWQGWPECRRPGRRGGRPHSPHVVGAGPPRSTCAATERGLCPGQGPRSGPLAGLALRRARVARATAGGQLDRAGLARPWPPHFPDCRRQAGRAAAPPPHRVGRVSARRPEGRVGRGPPAGGTRTGAPFPGRYPAERTKRGSAHRALPLVC